MADIVFRGNRAQLMAKIRDAVAAMSGRAPDKSGLIEGMLTGIGKTFLEKTSAAYEVKSEGGADDMGISWPPLSPVTLALKGEYSRRTVEIRGKKKRETAEAAMERIKKKMMKKVHTRKMLEIHYEKLLELYAQRTGAGAKARRRALRLAKQIAKHKKDAINRIPGLSNERRQAKIHAVDKWLDKRERELRHYHPMTTAPTKAQTAEGRKLAARLKRARRLKRERREKVILHILRAQEKLRAAILKRQKMRTAPSLAEAHAYHLLLRDTGRMFASLDAKLGGVGDQHFVLAPGSVTVGSNVEYFPHHQVGRARLPRRQVLPDSGERIPASWWRAIRANVAEVARQKSFWLTMLGSQARSA